MRLTDADLITEVIEMSGPKRRKRSARPAPRDLGYPVTSWMLQALSAECLLKGFSVRDAGRFRKTHDLLKLLETLDPDTQAEIAG